MSQLDRETAKQQIIKAAQQVQRVASMKEGLFSRHDHNRLMDGSLAELTTAIEKHLDKVDAITTNQGEVENAEDYIISYTQISRETESLFMLQSLLGEVSERRNREREEYWRSVEKYYEGWRFDAEGDPVESISEHESDDSPVEPTVMMRTDERERLEILLCQLEITNDTRDSATLLSHTEYQRDTTREFGVAVTRDVPAASGHDVYDSNAQAKDSDSIVAPNASLQDCKVWIPTHRALEIARALDVGLSISALSKKHA